MRNIQTNRKHTLHATNNVALLQNGERRKFNVCTRKEDR